MIVKDSIWIHTRITINPHPYPIPGTRKKNSTQNIPNFIASYQNLLLPLHVCRRRSTYSTLSYPRVRIDSSYNGTCSDFLINMMLQMIVIPDFYSSVLLSIQLKLRKWVNENVWNCYGIIRNKNCDKWNCHCLDRTTRIIMKARFDCRYDSWSFWHISVFNSIPTESLFIFSRFRISRMRPFKRWNDSNEIRVSPEITWSRF